MKFDITLAKYRTMTIDARDKRDALRRADFLKNPGEKVVSSKQKPKRRHHVPDAK